LEGPGIRCVRESGERASRGQEGRSGARLLG
jgi:hypothetical protein